MSDMMTGMFGLIGVWEAMILLVLLGVPVVVGIVVLVVVLVSRTRKGDVQSRPKPGE